MKWLKKLFTSQRETFVLNRKKCPVCQSHLVGWKESRWKCDEQGQRVSHSQYLRATCPKCEQLTVDDPWMPDNDHKPMTVVPYEIDWVKCPHCGWRFTLSDASSWSDGRHRKCGQRLRIEGDESEVAFIR